MTDFDADLIAARNAMLARELPDMHWANDFNDNIGVPRVRDATFLIRKHGGYYRPNSQGYTGSAIQAGRYTEEQAVDITHPNGPKGPRDGMTFIHEDDVKCEDWVSYRALEAQLAESQAREAVAYEVAAHRCKIAGVDEYAPMTLTRNEAFSACAEHLEREIRAFTPTHTTAALERMMAEAREPFETLAADMAEQLNKMTSEHCLEVCYGMAVDVLDMHTERSAAILSTLEEAP